MDRESPVVRDSRYEYRPGTGLFLPGRFISDRLLSTPSLYGNRHRRQGLKGYFWANSLLTQLNALALFIGLSSTAITAAGGGTITEPSTSGTNYTRPALGLSAWVTPSNGVTSNVAGISWLQASAAWWGGTSPCLWFMLMDSATVGAGNLYYAQVLPSAQQQLVYLGNTLSFVAGILQIQET